MAVRAKNDEKIILKIANVSDKAVTRDVALDGAKKVEAVGKLFVLKLFKQMQNIPK